jgi:hypothetical protein
LKGRVRPGEQIPRPGGYCFGVSGVFSVNARIERAQSVGIFWRASPHHQPGT